MHEQRIERFCELWLEPHSAGTCSCDSGRPGDFTFPTNKRQGTQGLLYLRGSLGSAWFQNITLIQFKMKKKKKNHWRYKETSQLEIKKTQGKNGEIVGGC